MVLELACPVDDEMADESKVGRSKMSDKRSTFRAIIRALFRRSSTSFSALLVYLVEKAMACSSKFGMASCRVFASAASEGRVCLRLERYSAEAIMGAFDLAASDWRERRAEWEAWVSDCGSTVAREASGRVDRRLRYLFVIGSSILGTGRTEEALSK